MSFVHYLINYGPVFLLLPFVYKAISTIIRKKIQSALTALDEIPLLGLPRKDGRKIRGTAVICGGSIAGLLSARICSDHFENVVMIEGEEWLATKEGLEDRHRQGFSVNPPCEFHKRSHVPQYTSVHVYQPFTTLALRQLFADFDLEVQKAGARFLPSDLTAHWTGVSLLAPRHQYPDDTFPTTMYLTRPGYETTLRRLVMTACTNVKYVSGTVTGLVPHESLDIVASVRMRSPAGTVVTVPATLVIDCTGPALGGLRWLQEFSSELAPAQIKDEKARKISPHEVLKTSYNPKMAYSTCEFDIPPRLFPRLNSLGPWRDYENTEFQYLNYPDAARDNRNLYVTRREHNFLQILCGGWDVQERMSSIGDIKSFLSQIVTISDHPIPEWIHSMLELFEEEQVPVTYVHARCPPSVYVQYHRAKKLPSNFIAIGDSVLQLNPIRGHGCTKACVEAVSLNTLLSRCLPMPSGGSVPHDSLPEDFGRTFFSIQARRTGTLWEAYKAEDYAWTSTIPTKGEDLQSFGAWRRAYGAAVTRLALKDREVAAVWWHTTNWLAPPTDMFSPMIVAKVAWKRLKDGIRS